MNGYQKLKKRVYGLIASHKGDGGKAAVAVDIFLCVLVALSGAAVIVELFFNISESLRHALEQFEIATVVVFIFEYILRLWTSEFEYPEQRNKLASLWEYVTSFDSLVDIISIASIVFNGIPKELAFLRLIKLLKLVRLVKIAGYVNTSGKMSERLQKIQERTVEIIDKGEKGDVASKIFDFTSVALILISVSFILVETFPISELAHRIMYAVEVGIAVVFAVEYVLRVWTAPLHMPQLRPDKARMKYIFSFMSLIDLLSIVPIFVANLPTATGILKIFKLCKILRLLKASRYLSSIANFGLAIQKKKKQIIMSIIAMVVLIMICSVLMYSFESKEQPEIFVHGFSGIYYSYQTMVAGGADMEMVTPMGQALATAMLLLGGCIIGVPVAIIATGFEDMIEEQAAIGEEPQDEMTEIYETLKLYDGMSDADKRRFERILAGDRAAEE